MPRTLAHTAATHIHATTHTTASTGSRRGKRPQYPMTSGLGDHNVADVVEQAVLLWSPEGMHLHPGDTSKVIKTAHQIQAWATQHGIASLAGLTGQTASQMLRDLTNIRNITTTTKPKQLDRLHRLRNALIALRGAVLITDDGDNRLRAHRPAGDTLAAELPTIAPRSPQKRRPLEDDEILLARTLVEIDLREEADLLPLLAYLIGESGVRCQPSTAVTTESLDDRDNPTTIKVQRVWREGTRRVKLDPYVSQTLARVLARTPAGARALTYQGKQPGTGPAGASLTPVIQRFLRRAGIDSPEITQMSLAMWRPWHALTVDNNIRRARKYHGGRTRNLLAELHCQLDEENLHKGLVDVVHRPTGKTVARVPAHHCNDHI